jgi:CRISPR-associated protein Cmr6
MSDEVSMNTRSFLLHALSPLHAGTGHAADVIDLPTARMKATGIPFVSGSSIKGVLRDARNTNGADAEKVLAVFGPETEQADHHAGAHSSSATRACWRCRCGASAARSPGRPRRCCSRSPSAISKRPTPRSPASPDAARSSLGEAAASIKAGSDYARSFDRWKTSFSAPGDRVFELALVSRLLVGHGNSSATDVGLTVHHTWGVPVIPGSALKGLLAHYVDAVYGPSDPERKPWEQEGDERTRADYQGVTWRGRRIERGPGAVYRALFGAPDAQEDDAMRERSFDAGASAGLVTFHDALYVPEGGADDRPFAADVLTVHQKDYYDSSGGSWPNDYDSPNPVAFLTIRPGARLLFALSGPADWTDLAERLLRDALDRWGVGGKTSAGYGWLIAPERSVARAQPATAAAAGAVPKSGDRVEAVLLEERTKKGGWKARHEPSGLAGPIQNSADVPATEKAGGRLTLIVASVSAREIAFRVPTGATASSPQKRERK